MIAILTIIHQRMEHPYFVNWSLTSLNSQARLCNDNYMGVSLKYLLLSTNYKSNHYCPVKPMLYPLRGILNFRLL